MTDKPEPDKIKKLIYQPGQFKYLMNEDFASDIWNFLTAPKSIQSLIDATSRQRPAIDILLFDIESSFALFLGSSEYRDGDVPILVNNMIKQIMEYLGYEHTGCALYPNAKYIKSSGMYKKTEALNNN